MFLDESLTTERILAVFTEEVGIRRGQVIDTFNQGARLFARAVLPHVADVRPGDDIRGGVAIKATQDGVWLYPYTFRLLCSNGAIIARTLEERPIAHPHLQEPEAVLQALRETVEICCKEEVFSSAIQTMRESLEVRRVDLLFTILSSLSRFPTEVQDYLLSQLVGPEAREAQVSDPTRSVLPLLSQLSARHNSDLLPRVVDEFTKEGDQSQFGLANAITAVARDVQDPELKWDLEKLGGAVAVGTAHISPSERVLAAAPLVDADLVRTA